MPDSTALQVYLDEQACDVGRPQPATISELIDRLKPRLDDDQRMVVRISCDHATVGEADLDRVLDQSPADYQRLDLTSASVPEVVGGALDAAESLLQGTRAQQTEIVEQLRGDRIDEAITLLSECVLAWSEAHHTLVSIVHLMRIDIEHTRVGERRVLDVLNQLAEQLKQVRDSLQARDYVLLGDLLQYEIIPTFNDWEGLVTTLRRAVDLD